MSKKKKKRVDFLILLFFPFLKIFNKVRRKINKKKKNESEKMSFNPNQFQPKYSCFGTQNYDHGIMEFKGSSSPSTSLSGIGVGGLPGGNDGGGLRSTIPEPRPSTSTQFFKDESKINMHCKRKSNTESHM